MSEHSLEPSPAELGETMTVAPGAWTPLDDHGTEIYVYGDQAVDVAVQRADVDDEVRRLRAEVEQLRKQLAEREYEPAVPVYEQPVTSHPHWAQHEYGCGGGRQCRCVIPEAERPNPNHACAAHDDAHLGRPCPDRSAGAR